MSEQTNPTDNESTDNAEETLAVAESSTTESDAAGDTASSASDASPQQSAPERTQQPAPQPSSREDAHSSSASRASRYDADDDYDEDYDDEYEDDYDDEDEDLYVDGPAQYVQRERGGRGRRIGSDIRVTDIDYKNVALLSRFLDRRGRILSRRRTRVSAKVQRRIVKAIKRARHLALLPYTGDHTRIVRKRR